MAEHIVLVIGGRRGRQSITLPFALDDVTRNVVLCANVSQAGEVSAALARATACALVTAGSDDKVRGRDLLPKGHDPERLAVALRILGIEAELLERRVRELRAAERFRVSLLAAHSAGVLIVDMASVGGSVFEVADAFQRLRHLRAEFGFATIVCISDPAYLTTAGDLCTVLDAQSVVAHGPTTALVADPPSEYLGARLVATPLTDPRLQQRRRMLGAQGIPANDAPLPLDLAARERRHRTEPVALQQLPLTNETQIIEL